MAEVKRDGDTLTLKVKVDEPGMVGGQNFAWGFRRRQLQVAEAADTSDESVGLSLYDAGGKRLPGVVKADENMLPGGGMNLGDYHLSYKLEKGQQPARLVLTGRRNVFIDVPFALKDLPLPGK